MRIIADMLAYFPGVAAFGRADLYGGVLAMEIRKCMLWLGAALEIILRYVLAHGGRELCGRADFAKTGCAVIERGK